MPLLIAFQSSKGIELGQPIEWLCKLWLVRLSDGSGCFVMPCQVLWAYLP